MRAIKINDIDNVAVALEPLTKGEILEIGSVKITLEEDIPQGNKFALTPILEGQDVIKYGMPIGHIISDVTAGSLVDHSLVKTNLSEVLEYVYEPDFGDDENGAEAEEANSDANTNSQGSCCNAASSKKLTYLGYRRQDGSVGIRNEIWIIPTVGCVNGTAQQLAQLSQELCRLPNINAILAYTHNYGCSQLGDDHQNTRKILRDMALHPNAAGVLFVGLGCENNQVSELKKFIGDDRDGRIRYLETQKVADEIEEGLAIIKQLSNIAIQDRRVPCPVSTLRIGLKCGGSDGLSGITANPLLGRLSDFMASKGASMVLTEVPEMFGAETLLFRRCASEDVFNRAVAMVNDFKQYFIDNNQPIYENPSPGNKAGGISTLEEKSLGCVQKGGTSPVVDVLRYGERVTTRGLSLLYGPGNDLVASTALAAAGCQMVLFTTGRGTPFGTFVPTVKVSTNTSLKERKRKWIDFDAGVIASGENQDEVLKDFVSLVLEIASGKKTQNEVNGFRDFAIFKTGVTL